MWALTTAQIRTYYSPNSGIPDYLFSRAILTHPRAVLYDALPSLPTQDYITLTLEFFRQPHTT